MRIRDPNYGEMGSVADLIMSCFYETAVGPAKPLYRLGELNRLQQNFPYERARHRMFVALATTLDECKDQPKTEVVGFCDIDARKPNRPTSYVYNPRPYLSDLCVAPGYRRLGIAQMLIQRCEEFCLELEQREAFVRVERTNDIASRMYAKLGYSEHWHPLETPGKTIVLQKDLLGAI